jgi:hypothetical protein
MCGFQPEVYFQPFEKQLATLSKVAKVVVLFI